MYIYLLIYSRVLFDNTHKDSTRPPKARVEIWLENLRNAISVSLQYTEQLGSILVNRANHLRRKMRELKRGGPRA